MSPPSSRSSSVVMGVDSSLHPRLTGLGPNCALGDRRNIPGLDGRSLGRLQVQEIELGPAGFGQTKGLAGAEHKTLRAYSLHQSLQVILRRPPDPADIPPDSSRLLGG